MSILGAGCALAAVTTALVGDASILSIVRDLVVITAAVVGMYVGLRGLRTWTRQLAGATTHDLARKVLRSLTRLQDAILDVKRVTHERAFFSRAVAERVASVSSPVLSDPDSLLEPRMRRVSREHAVLAGLADDVMYVFEGVALERLDAVFQVFAKFELAYAIESQRGPDHKFTGDSARSIFCGGDEGDRFDQELNKAFGEAVEFFRRQLARR